MKKLLSESNEFVKYIRIIVGKQPASLELVDALWEWECSFFFDADRCQVVALTENLTELWRTLRHIDGEFKFIQNGVTYDCDLNKISE